MTAGLKGRRLFFDSRDKHFVVVAVINRRIANKPKFSAKHLQTLSENPQTSVGTRRVCTRCTPGHVLTFDV